MIGERTVVNGCYILVERIGGDAFSDWWRASAIFVASNFLLRFLKDDYTGDTEMIREFIEAGRVRSKIVSPAVVDILEIDRFESKYFIASEFGSYRHLASVLAKGRKFTLEHACRLVIELAEGVDAFHQRGLLFESLNPETIIVSESGDTIEEIKVLAPGYGPLLSLIPESDDGPYRDYWAYTAPEQKRGGSSDARADIYSLGIILFRFLTGKLPYGSKAGAKVRHNSASPSHVARALARRGLPIALATVVVKALRKRPSMRYDYAIDFIDELRAVLDTRRSETMREGGVDPIAGLASLNLKRAKADAREIVRSLETTDYFRLLKSTGPVTAIPLNATKPTWFDDNDEDVSSLEDLEALDDDDDEDISTAQYVYAGYAAARSTAKPLAAPQHIQQTAAPATEQVIRQAAPSAAAQVTKQAAAPVTRQSAQQDKPLEPAISQKASVIQPAAPTGTTPRTKNRASREAALRWKQAGGSVKEVADAILRAAMLAAAGAGTVKFIEEPANHDSERMIEKTLVALSGESLLVDIGFLTKNASHKDIRREIEHRLGSSAQPSPFQPEASDNTVGPRSVRYQARRDAYDFWQLTSAEKPLILVARNTEQISISAHHFLMEYARLAVSSSACGFFFYGPGSVPKWHILRSLEQGIK